MATLILALIIAKRSIANHRNYEVMNFSSDSEHFDADIPSVLPRKEQITSSSNYVVCVMDGKSVAQCDRPPMEIPQETSAFASPSWAIECRTFPFPHIR
jgi:hypothetical protein